MLQHSWATHNRCTAELCSHFWFRGQLGSDHVLIRDHMNFIFTLDDEDKHKISGATAYSLSDSAKFAQSGTMLGYVIESEGGDY